MPKRQENLIPLNKRTKTEQRQIAKKGGIKSGEVRREKKAFKELFNAILESEVTDTQLNKILNKFGAKDKSYKQLLAITTIKSALKGDIRALENIISIIGEKPKENDTNEDVLQKLDKLLESQSAELE